MKKIGVISYLNALPLYYAIENNIIPHDYELLKGVPAATSNELLAGNVDLAIISSIEFARNPGKYKIIPEVCIGSRKKVNSVLFFFNSNQKKFRKIALDPASRSAQILLKILIREKFELDEVEFEEVQGTPENLLNSYDGVLQVGDKALKYKEQLPHFLDLVEEWKDFTNLPFVFAFWAGKISQVEEDDVKNLILSKNLGMKYIKEIAENADLHPNIDWVSVFEYLTENLDYNFDSQMEEGLKKFWEMAFYYGEIPHIPNITYFK